MLMESRAVSYHALEIRAFAWWHKVAFGSTRSAEASSRSRIIFQVFTLRGTGAQLARALEYTRPLLLITPHTSKICLSYILIEVFRLKGATVAGDSCCATHKHAIHIWPKGAPLSTKPTSLL